jgi:7-cyano-7-deazaguanine synthase
MEPSASAIALLSAGLDSAVAVLLALEQGWKIPLALTYDYGQRSAKQEIAQAKALCAHFGIPHQSLPLPWFREWAQSSALLNPGQALPQPEVGNLDVLELARQTAKAVWVPNRNGIFIEIAAGFAEHRGAKAVIVGFNREEAQTFPDNSEAYLTALTHSLRFSTANGVAVVSPTAAFDKKEIVRRGVQSGFPFSLLWSCYEGESRMCGRCESCQRLKRALGANGVDTHALFKNSDIR